MRESYLVVSTAIAAVILGACGGGDDAEVAGSGADAGAAADAASANADANAVNDANASSDAHATPDAGDAGPDAAPSDVAGTIVLHRVLGDGSVTDDPIDLGSVGATASAYVTTSTGWNPPIVATTSAGAFTIAAVPAGEYYLGVSYGASSTPEYYVSDSRTIDVGYGVAGRINPATAGANTKLSIYATFPATQTYDTGSDGASSFPQRYSNIQFYSANAGAFAYSLDEAASPLIALGATKLNPMISSYTAATVDVPTLVSQGSGDSAFLVLQSKLMAGAALTPYLSPTGSATLTLTMTTGTTTTVGSSGTSTAMAAVPASNTVTIASWQRKAFDDLKGDMTAGGTTAVAAYQRLNVEAQPGGLTTYGVIAPNPQLVDMATHDSTTNLALGDVKYGDPYPSTWGVYGGVTSAFTITMMPTAGSVDTIGTIATVAPIATLGSTIGPVVGPVQTPTINALPLNAAHTSIVANNSTISWSAPTVGTASFYDVMVYTFDSTPSIKAAARILTGGTSIKIPPGVLTSGSQYFVRIRAYNAPGSAIKTKPKSFGPTYGWADFVSAIFTAG